MKEQFDTLARESRSTSKSVSFQTTLSSSSNPVKSIKKDTPVLTKNKGKQIAAALNPSDDDGDDSDNNTPGHYRSSGDPRGHSPSRFSSMSYVTRIEKIPNLLNKLSNGVEYSPKL